MEASQGIVRLQESRELRILPLQPPAFYGGSPTGLFFAGDRPCGGVFSVVLIQIKSGEGGADAEQFCGELARMYRRFSETQANWSCSLERERPGDVLLRISGEGCNRRLAGECGKHVIQRVPRTEKHGRRQTSVVSVAVLPLPSCGDWTIPDADIEVFTKRGQGPGGQHRNKTESCVVARHVPTGIEAKVDARHQQTNRQIALQRLRERVREVSVAAERRDYNALRQSQMSGGGEIGGRGAKRRTYNFIDSRVVDHVSGRETRDVKSVLNGKLELVL